MKYYHKYQKALESAGYRVDEHGYVWDANGNQSAGEDNYGNVQSKDANVNEICRLADDANVNQSADDANDNQSAGEDNYGNVQSKDANVNEICRLDDVAPKPKKAKAPKKAVNTLESGD